MCWKIPAAQAWISRSNRSLGGVSPLSLLDTEAGYELAITIGIGDAWLAAVSSPLLMVPSVIVPEEFNVLINPAHPAAAKINVKPVRQHRYDPRL